MLTLAELDERQLFLAEGYSSLFKYCTNVLHFSEHAAYNRIEAARAVRGFPVLLEHLAAGRVNLFTVRRLAPHLTTENHRDVLPLAQHKSRGEIEEIVARLRPLPPVPDVVRKLPTRNRVASEPTALPVPSQGGDAFEIAVALSELAAAPICSFTGTGEAAGCQSARARTLQDSVYGKRDIAREAEGGTGVVASSGSRR